MDPTARGLSVVLAVVLVALMLHGRDAAVNDALEKLEQALQESRAKRAATVHLRIEGRILPRSKSRWQALAAFKLPPPAGDLGLREPEPCGEGRKSGPDKEKAVRLSRRTAVLEEWSG
jgi:hypothetical protein